MPELPEVETIRLILKRDIIGKVVKDIDIRVKKQFVGQPQDIFNKKITALTRKGKVLSIKIGNKYVNIHLKLTGQLLFAENKNQAVFKNEVARAGTNEMPGRTTRIIIYFSDDSALYFNDLRKFGWMRLLDKPEETSAVDLLSPKFTLTYFKKSISNSKKPIKNLLLEQDKFTGIGNIYANDALWKARIHPLRKTNTLNDVEIGELFRAIKSIISEGLKYDGTSDDFYILPNALKGNYQKHVKVYHREGLPCLRCGTALKRIKHGGRSSFFCPQCQNL